MVPNLVGGRNCGGHFGWRKDTTSFWRWNPKTFSNSEVWHNSLTYNVNSYYQETDIDNTYYNNRRGFGSCILEEKEFLSLI